MKPRRAASASEGERDGHRGPPIGGNDPPLHRRRPLRLSPIAAVGIAFAGLTLGIGTEFDPFSFRLGKSTTCSPADAVDISLQLLMRLRVAHRLESEQRTNSAPSGDRPTIDDELDRLRKHPLYVSIKEMLAAHLRNQGYVRVPINRMRGALVPTVSTDVRDTLHTFMHSLQASFPVPNESIATFLKDCEENYGKSIAEHRGTDRYDVAFTFLIQLLAGYPDDLEPVASAVRFLPLEREEIERTLRGAAPELSPRASRTARWPSARSLSATARW